MPDPVVQTSTAALTGHCRLLYYGPPGGGKSANLAQISACVPASFRVSVPPPERGERIGFRVDAGDLGQWTVIVEAVDPLGGGERAGGGGGFPFDAIVFVADSSADRLDENLSSLESLKTELESGGYDLTSLPMIIQYNKQDSAGRLPVERLESLLNPWGLPSFPAVASRGEGVRESLRAALGLALRQLRRQAGDEGEEDPAERSPEAMAPAPVAPAITSSPPALAGGSARPARSAGAEGPAGGRGLQIEPDELHGTLFSGRRPPLVVPVRVPRSVLERHGSFRIVLELEIDERGPRVV